MRRGMGRIVVAIDGPAGAGKSTVTKLLSRALGYELLDTGALYRTVALLARRRGLSWNDAQAVAGVAGEMEISFSFVREVNHVFLAGDDVTELIRTPEMSTGASRVSALPEVRAALLDLQRELGRGGGVVAEGRDVGTVVFPGAEAKFFLTASVEVRAQRRYDELVSKGAEVDLAATMADIQERDERDSNRAVAPLVQAPDAVLVDCSELSPEFVVATMLAVVKERAEGVGGAG
jgi:cytidylate kinase